MQVSHPVHNSSLICATKDVRTMDAGRGCLFIFRNTEQQQEQQQQRKETSFELLG
jgi:hypothetical protein